MRMLTKKQKIKYTVVPRQVVIIDESRCNELRVGHGLDPSMDWIGLDPITVIPCFFHL